MNNDKSMLKGLENFILLVLGAYDRKISLLHLEKEVFLLWNFHPGIKHYLQFIKHYRGPFSAEIVNIIHNPFYLENCWIYESPKKGDALSGGYVKLTHKGKNEYEKLYGDAKNKSQLWSLLTGIKMVRDLYDKLTLEELLLLIYDTYPEYREKSNVFIKIENKKGNLAKKLLEKGFIDDERYNSLLVGI